MLLYHLPNFPQVCIGLPRWSDRLRGFADVGLDRTESGIIFRKRASLGATSALSASLYQGLRRLGGIRPRSSRGEEANQHEYGPAEDYGAPGRFERADCRHCFQVQLSKLPEGTFQETRALEKT